MTYMRAGIDAVAVTDHNSGEWIDRLKAALVSPSLTLHADFRPLVIFPGVEMTANGGVHILGVFDPLESGSKVTYLMGACKIAALKETPPVPARTPPRRSLTRSSRQEESPFLPTSMRFVARSRN